MTNLSKSSLWVAVLVITASCGYTSPYRSSGPAVSKEGVQVAIVGERCYVNRSAEDFPTTVNDDQLNLAMRVQIKNKASHTAALSLDNVRLAETTGGAQTLMVPRESESLSLLPGATTVVSLDFEQSGTLDCHHEMALDVGRAIKIEGGEVGLQPIRFLAAE